MGTLPASLLDTSLGARWGIGKIGRVVGTSSLKMGFYGTLPRVNRKDCVKPICWEE